jgi:cytochrome c peroxidase
MGSSIQEVILKLNREPLYLDLFKKAFNDSIITGEHVLKALSQFQLTLISANSKYDQFVRGEVNLNCKEQKGLSLFEKHCNSCHKTPLFSSYEYKNNGLALDSTLLDYGRFEITKNEADALLFKVPSLRNLSFTYPYMHDGRYRYLKEVINHYDALDTENVLLSKNLRKPLKLSAEDKVNLTAFLLTLNDTSFIFNSAHQYPKVLYNIQKTNFN